MAASNNDLNLSSSGVQIMSSMADVSSSCDSSITGTLSEYEKPGYQLCTHVEKFMHTDAGTVPVIKTELALSDVFSTVLVRCGINRHRYTAAPGLYAVGLPDKSSEVLVTANFKLTFDHLRKELQKLNVWVLVLDTKGVNVWCAAGKGTFATNELVNRIQKSALNTVVDHKRIIVPQLGATGVSARKVKQLSGFRVIYGPVRAKDIHAFLTNKKKADATMRQVTFTMEERLVLTPVELQIVLKPALITAVILMVLSGLGPGFFSFSNALERGIPSLIALISGILSGAFITPVLLPFIPFRTFAVKGIIAGSILIFLTLLLFSGPLYGISGGTALFLFSVSVSSFLAMNFTGSTPYTSPSGVEKEMKQFIPVQLTAVIVSCGLWIYSAF